MYGFSQGLHTHEICIYIQLPPPSDQLPPPSESKNSHRLNVVIAIALLDQTLTIVVHCLPGDPPRGTVSDMYQVDAAYNNDIYRNQCIMNSDFFKKNIRKGKASYSTR